MVCYGRIVEGISVVRQNKFDHLYTFQTHVRFSITKKTQNLISYSKNVGTSHNEMTI